MSSTASSRVSATATQPGRSGTREGLSAPWRPHNRSHVKMKVAGTRDSSTRLLLLPIHREHRPFADELGSRDDDVGRLEIEHADDVVGADEAQAVFRGCRGRREGRGNVGVWLRRWTRMYSSGSWLGASHRLTGENIEQRNVDVIVGATDLALAQKARGRQRVQILGRR